MRYFFDLEFIDNGVVIDPLSIGIVSEDGREYYAEFINAQWTAANEWVTKHVLPLLGKNPVNEKSDAQIRDDLRSFVTGDPEFWGYFCAYDFVAICQLFGTLMNLPEHWPKFAMDINQWSVMMANSDLPNVGKDEHHALNDARWIRDAWKVLDRSQRRRFNSATVRHRGGCAAGWD